MTRKKPTSQPAPESWQYCSWHRAHATCVLIDAFDQGSACGVALYACADCRTEHGLVPVSTRRDGPTSAWNAAGAAS